MNEILIGDLTPVCAIHKAFIDYTWDPVARFMNETRAARWCSAQPLWRGAVANSCLGAVNQNENKTLAFIIHFAPVFKMRHFPALI